MKKVIILLIATLLISCQTEFGKFDEDKDFIYGICYDYETDENGYYIITFERQLKLNNNELRVRSELAEKSKNTKYHNYFYTLMKMKYDFANDRSCLVSYTDYDVDDKVIDSFTAPRDHFEEVKATELYYVAAKQLVYDSKNK